MAENSETYPKSGKPPTQKTAQLTPDMLLEIFQAGLVKMKKAGLDVRIMPVFGDGEKWIAIHLYGVEIIDRRLVLAKHETAETTVATTGNPDDV